VIGRAGVGGNADPLGSIAGHQLTRSRGALGVSAIGGTPAGADEKGAISHRPAAVRPIAADRAGSAGITRQLGTDGVCLTGFGGGVTVVAVWTVTERNQTRAGIGCGVPAHHRLAEGILIGAAAALLAG